MTAWKRLELRVAKALGGTRAGPLGRYGSDINDVSFSVEVKRTSRLGLRAAWVTQARRQGKAEGKPWLLVVAGHNDRRPLWIADFWQMAELAQQAGWIGTVEDLGDEDEAEDVLTLDGKGW